MSKLASHTAATSKNHKCQVDITHMSAGKSKLQGNIRQQANAEEAEAGGETHKLAATFVLGESIEIHTKPVHKEDNLVGDLPGLSTPGDYMFMPNTDNSGYGGTIPSKSL